MRDELMAVEIEIDPFGRAAALAAAKHAAVKGARGGEIVDRKGEMERADRIGHRVPALSHPPPLGESIAEPDRRAAIGRESGRERVWQYLEISVVTVSLKKNT